MYKFKRGDKVIVQCKTSRYSTDTLIGFELGHLIPNKVARIRMISKDHRAFVTYDNINDECVAGWWVGVDVIVLANESKQGLPNWF